MPGFNRQGPNNEGPKTGRGFGKCNPKIEPQINTDEVNLSEEESWYGVGRDGVPFGGGQGRLFGGGRGTNRRLFGKRRGSNVRNRGGGSRGGEGFGNHGRKWNNK
jgi:hypothetical protein